MFANIFRSCCLATTLFLSFCDILAQQNPALQSMDDPGLDYQPYHGKYFNSSTLTREVGNNKRSLLPDSHYDGWHYFLVMYLGARTELALLVVVWPNFLELWCFCFHWDNPRLFAQVNKKPSICGGNTYTRGHHGRKTQGLHLD